MRGWINLARVLTLATLLVSTAAHASFHLYQISQIYSDASGNVQYVEFATQYAGQEFLSLTSLQASNSGMTHDFPFPSNLPVPMVQPSTANTRFLVATQGFADLMILTPDYIVPNNFLFIPNGTVSLLGADTVTYLALPADGSHAINRQGTQVTAMPTNFAGATACVSVPPPTPAGVYDIDGNGVVEALYDGLLLMRYLFNVRGDALIAGAVAPCATRKTAMAIELHIASQIP